jgi:hypothetical protein
LYIFLIALIFSFEMFSLILINEIKCDTWFGGLNFVPAVTLIQDYSYKFYMNSRTTSSIKIFEVVSVTTTNKKSRMRQKNGSVFP